MRRETALVCKRAERAPVETAEITRLAAAGGYDVVGTETQVRGPDPATQFGAGKLRQIADRVERDEIETLVVDNDLSPKQAFNVREACDTPVTVVDRYRLVLDIFEEQAREERARMQVRLARLRRELPFVRERVSRELDGEMQEHDEEGKEVEDLKRQIERLEARLAERSDDRDRSALREQGFRTIALAGYTNAGKSTLLHRLSDDLDVTTVGDSHDDVEETAAVEDRLFKTLETTTRKATVNDRRFLVTDTVGLVESVPHDLVEAFGPTLTEARESDLLLVVVDASDPPDAVETKLRTSLEVLGEVEGERQVVLNKVDTLTEAELAERRQVLDPYCERPVEISATRGIGIDDLADRITTLDDDVQTTTLQFSVTDEGMSLLSWLHDNGSVLTETYADDGSHVEVDFEGRPTVVEKAKSRATSL